MPASYQFNDVAMLISDWHIKYDQGPQSRLPLQADEVYSLMERYLTNRGTVVTRPQAMDIKKDIVQLRKATGRRGGNSKRIATEKELLKEVIDEIKFAMKYPE